MFKLRSYTKELLDEPVIQKPDLYQNLKELEVINNYLGGHNISINGLGEVITDKSKTYHITDIGCGGGDSLKAIARWAIGKGYKVRLTGIDIKQDCIEYAQSNCSQYPEIKFICTDFWNLFLETVKPDIVHASLFCHHFTENEISEFIRLCSNGKAVFIINDLERNPLAYYSIKLLTRLFSKSLLVKNDAPLSVLRGFKKTEWKEILSRAGVKKYILKSKWAFRHLAIVYPNE